jgi:hypothetical protein
MMGRFCALAFCTAKYIKHYTRHIYPCALLIGIIYVLEIAIYERKKTLWKVCVKFGITNNRKIVKVIKMNKPIKFSILILYCGFNTFLVQGQIKNIIKVPKFFDPISLKIIDKELKENEKVDSLFIYLQDAFPGLISTGIIFLQKNNKIVLKYFLVDIYAKKYQIQEIKSPKDSLANFKALREAFYFDRDTLIDINSRHALEFAIIFKDNSNTVMKYDYTTFFELKEAKYLSDFIEKIGQKYHQLLADKLSIETKAYYKKHL